LEVDCFVHHSVLVSSPPWPKKKEKKKKVDIGKYISTHDLARGVSVRISGIRVHCVLRRSCTLRLTMRCIHYVLR